MLQPMIVAVLLGLTVSAGIYFLFLWPEREPDDWHDD